MSFFDFLHSSKCMGCDKCRPAKVLSAHIATIERDIEVLRYRIQRLEIKPESATAADIIANQRKRDEERKKAEHGPAPISWVGKAAQLEYLTEDPRFENAQRAHEGI